MIHTLEARQPKDLPAVSIVPATLDLSEVGLHWDTTRHAISLPQAANQLWLLHFDLSMAKAQCFSPFNLHFRVRYIFTLVNAYGIPDRVEFTKMQYIPAIIFFGQFRGPPRFCGIGVSQLFWTAKGEDCASRYREFKTCLKVRKLHGKGWRTLMDPTASRVVCATGYGRPPSTLTFLFLQRQMSDTITIQTYQTQSGQCTQAKRSHKLQKIFML